MRIMARILFVLFCLFPSATFATQSFDGLVVKIADGDTVTVLMDDKRQIKVRLYGVDCPESRQAFGNRAKQFVSSLVFGERVAVEVMDVDRYGRTVGIVTTENGIVVNRELLSGGMAWVYDAYCRAPVCGEWEKVEDEARNAEIGLWSDEYPIPPWEWRKQRR